ncbi:hypothetical protein BIFGAL_04264 [Bifidobacterium gallicum DSM 20093 = LMG 11596]|uniref:Uncharacterized protein n=1 Tax=Bifidobacterium gallicum DSM 20093 = LMG 11596 TaxID=561180 RepID=D1NWL0_9BIFI|nr:hypothetical protein BIFGAL_04264 [Bifidobacterium gallicum DSM 20093 = LMG 11596]
MGEDPERMAALDGDAALVVDRGIEGSDLAHGTPLCAGNGR